MLTRAEPALSEPYVRWATNTVASVQVWTGGQTSRLFREAAV